MTSDKRPKIRYRLSIILGVVLICVLGLVFVRACRPTPGPVPPAVTETPVRVTAAPQTPTSTATRAAATGTVTSTRVMTSTATATPTRAISPPSATTLPPTPVGATPIALRSGRVRVEAGDTLWGISCREYAAIPLRPGANPLTPCTCWPGLRLANGIENPRLILPGWRLGVPEACIQ